MDRERAQAIGGRLRLAAVWENLGIAARALECFPSSGDGYVWIPEGTATAHWLQGTSLLRATAGKEGEMEIVARPVEENTWSISARYRWGEFGPMNHQGLRTAWGFSMPGEQDDLEVAGGIPYRDADTPEPDEAEQFAQNLAKTLIGTA